MRAADLAEKDARERAMRRTDSNLRVYYMRHIANALSGFSWVPLVVARERCGRRWTIE